MIASERMKVMHDRLQQAFSPEKIEVIDDSHLHVGHAGAEGGAGHYTVVIASALLKSKSRVDAHREIYRVFDDLIPHEIHALKIKLV